MGRGRNRGRRKRKEAERAAHDHLSDKELDSALAEIASGSDRVAAIMGAALVQNSLMGALVTCLADDSDAAKLFDSTKGPLNSFYGQIYMGKALGLFDADIADALHKIRSIRNDFAHQPVSLTFEQPDIAKNCLALAKYEEKEVPRDDISEHRKYFEHACYELTCQLMAAGTKKVRERADDLERQVTMKLLGGQTNALGSLSDFLKLIPASVEDGG